jgi:glyoxylase-like metal-dependent hydrolase (beta-lactamase superfamily II)
LSGRDIAQNDPFAHQMVNFIYLIGDRETGDAVVIDPAYDPQGILDVLAADDMRLTGVLATHYHPDHVGGSMGNFELIGVPELMELVHVPVHVQTEESPLVQMVTGLTADDMVEHSSGDVVMVGDIPIRLVHTPGHTPGSQCFMLDGALVSGDTLFLDGCGRTDLPGGDAAALYHSLTHTLSQVPDDAILFPGHMYSAAASASMADTRRHNFVLWPKSEKDWLNMLGIG